MYRVSDSTKEVAMLYFLLIGIIGTNLMMNLLLAVIKESLSRVMTQMIKINKDKKLLALRKATIQAAMYGTPAEPRNSSFLTTALSISVSLLHAAKHYSEAALNRTSRVISDLAPAKEVEAAPPVDDTINVRLMGAISEGDGVDGGGVTTQGDGGWVTVDGGTIAQACRRITDSKLFNVFTMTLVFVNTIMLSAVYSGMSAETYYILELTAAVFNIFFLLESIMKIIGNSWAVFITNYFDVFDFVVVLAGIMELTLSVSQLQGSGVKRGWAACGVVSMMRAARLGGVRGGVGDECGEAGRQAGWWVGVGFVGGDAGRRVVERVIVSGEAGQWVDVWCADSEAAQQGAGVGRPAGVEGGINCVWTSFGLAAVYTVEAIIKIIASGFRGAQKAYLSEYWNVLDFSVLTMSLLTLGLELIYDKGGSNLSDLQSILVVFRLFRILRALRTVQKLLRVAPTLTVIGKAKTGLKRMYNASAPPGFFE
eukprot:gene21972-26464_t